METKHTKNSSNHCLYIIVSSVSSLSKAKLSFNNPTVSQKSEFRAKDGDFYFSKTFLKRALNRMRNEGRLCTESITAI